MELRTPRLTMRPWRDDDLAAYAALNDDPVVMEHFPARLTRAESDASAERIRSHFSREGFGLWALQTADAPFIGFTGLARPVFLPSSIEIGWRLARSHWNLGYATEAARAAATYAFTSLRLPEIIAFVVPSNTRSQAIMTKLGMTRDPAADFQHPFVTPGHPLALHWLYRLPAGDLR